MGRESRRRKIIMDQWADAREIAVQKRANKWAIRLLLTLGFVVGAVVAVGVQLLIGTL